MNAGAPARLIIAKLLIAAGCAAAAYAQPPQSIHCDVAIVGGGAGGLHTAFRLAPTLGSAVCVFEKEDRLGGRILDVSRAPGGPVFGAGALRIFEGQTTVFDLAAELGIEYEAGPWRDDLIGARGFFGFNSDELNAAAYPLVDDATTEDDLYDEVFSGPLREHTGEFPDVRSYIRAVVGGQGQQFLTDMSRFKADMVYPISAEAFLEFIESGTCCTPFYPVGGMSQFVDRMAARAKERGARIFLSEPVMNLARAGRSGRGRYILRTTHYEVSADRVVVAVDAQGFQHIGGKLAESIRAKPQFKDLLPVKVVTITQWWPQAWWLGAHAPRDVRRAWSTDTCVTNIEIPIAPYAADQLVTRTVYTDELSCVAFWEEVASRGTAAVEAEIQRGLPHLFPGVAIPAPLKTFVKVWPNAWYFIRGGSPFSNHDIEQWALEPLPGHAISMVGESYYPLRSGWTWAAYLSSIRTLVEHFGYEPPSSASAAQSEERGTTTAPGASRRDRDSGP
jgi:hypothetical protein